ncbi:MAG: serine protein kinase PrkA [Patescibacteria group bacterium]
MSKHIKKAIDVFLKDMVKQQKTILTFDEYLKRAKENPEHTFRNHFHFFHNVIKKNLLPEEDEDKNDPERIGFLEYDSSKLFETGFDRPFFSDTLLNNKLIKAAEAMYDSAQQNKIYIISGPPGSGKSTCVNNLLQKLEEEANSENEQRFEILWKIDKRCLGKCVNKNGAIACKMQEPFDANQEDNVLEIPCPSHDLPILVIPKAYRMRYMQTLFEDDKNFLAALGTKKYEWLFNDRCCTVCESIFWNLFDMLGLEATLQMLYAQYYEFNRRLGKGITVFNPDDMELKNPIISDATIQAELDELFKGNYKVHYAYSKYAMVNYGFYVLMDIKNQNENRLEQLHNILSEGIHKIGFVEEKVNSIFIAVVNPEDLTTKQVKSKESILFGKSFQDRQEFIKIPYILDPEKEINIFRATNEHDFDKYFLPRVLLNFARIVISTRMRKEIKSLSEWIGNPVKYLKYCDKDLMLLRMDLYKATVPKWLLEEDKKKFNALTRRKIISEAMETEGSEGCSGRDSVRLFYKFYSLHKESGKLINMSMLINFFKGKHEELVKTPIPDGFLDSLVKMYNYSVLQEIKESLFRYNEEQISKDIQNYLFAIFEDEGAEKICPYTGDKLKITDNLLVEMENKIAGKNITHEQHMNFRKNTANRLSIVLAQEIIGQKDKKITDTVLYKELRDSYFNVLKEKVLEPFWNNENFKRAIKDYGKKDFNTYDERIKTSISYLMKNLQEKFNYSENGAQEICLYALDENIIKQFS